MGNRLHESCANKAMDGWVRAVVGETNLRLENKTCSLANGVDLRRSDLGSMVTGDDMGEVIAEVWGG